MLKKELEKIGLNENEAKSYLFALELGKSTIDVTEFKNSESFFERLNWFLDDNLHNLVPMRFRVSDMSLIV